MKGFKSIIKRYLNRGQQQNLNGSCSIEHLPEEVLSMIFDFFDLPALGQFKRVCKKFCFVINRMKFNNKFNNELVVRRIGSEEATNIWFYTYRPILLKYMISTHQNDYLNQPSFMKSFAHLKRFKINVNKEFNLLSLCELTDLEQLEIDNIIDLRQDTVLELAKLRILSIKIFSNYKLIIDSNNLQALKCFKLSNIELFNPCTMKYIEVEFQNKFENLLMYSNLEVYKVRDISRLDKLLLSKMPTSLKSIHFYFPYEELAYNLIIDEIQSVLKQKTDLSQFNHLQVYFQGVKQIDKVRNVSYMNLISMKRCYQDLEDTLEWVDSIEYNDLVKAFGVIPSDFHKKFVNIQSVYLNTSRNKSSNRTVDEKKFSEFLKNCTSLSSLELVRPSFDQDFYERLVFICPLLKAFKLKESSKISLNYQFILDFRTLKVFSTNHYLHPQDAITFLSKSRMIEELVFEVGENEPVRISNFRSKQIYSLVYKYKRFIIEHHHLSTANIPELLKRVDNEIEESKKKRSMI